MVTDARGRIVPLVRLNLALLPWGLGPLPRTVQARVRTRMMNWSWKRENLFRADEVAYGTMIALLPSLVCFGPLFLAMGFGWPRGYWQLLASGAGLLIGLLALPEILWRTMPAARSRLVADEVLAAACCASCGYGLERVVSQDDGCTVCPECGAAWKLPTPAASNRTSTPT